MPTISALFGTDREPVAKLREEGLREHLRQVIAALTPGAPEDEAANIGDAALDDRDATLGEEPSCDGT